GDSGTDLLATAEVATESVGHLPVSLVDVASHEIRRDLQFGAIYFSVAYGIGSTRFCRL
ncbi:MAG: hypothetical protein QOD58_1671, partial [Mycobacterium sp.]|nr:hypothetical protein [Mycobacterium sp.]